jgi:gamma-glutamylcyclotransferase (GGCT)/AIG2-like uncharacterized protein YtfP
MRLAVYGTLRRGSPYTGKVEGFSLVFPGELSFPTLIKNKKGEGAVVEMVDVNDEDLSYFDSYENIAGGLYIRTTTDVNLDNGKTEKAWIYVAGPLLWENSKTFTEVPDGDWLSSKTLMMMNRVDDYERQTSEF